MTLTCAKCKQKYVLPDDALYMAGRLYVCDACWEKIMREAAERIRIKVGNK